MSFCYPIQYTVYIVYVSHIRRVFLHLHTLSLRLHNTYMPPETLYVRYSPCGRQLPDTIYYPYCCFLSLSPCWRARCRGSPTRATPAPFLSCAPISLSDIDPTRRWALCPEKTLRNPKEQLERVRARANERIVNLYLIVRSLLSSSSLKE